MEIPVVIQLENDLITAPPQPTSRHTNRCAHLLVAVSDLQTPGRGAACAQHHAPSFGCNSISASQPHSQPCCTMEVGGMRTANQVCVDKTTDCLRTTPKQVLRARQACAAIQQPGHRGLLPQL